MSAYMSELAPLAFETDQNDRRAMMFEALAADEWYCAGVRGRRATLATQVRK
jgi:hypothetical protein